TNLPPHSAKEATSRGTGCHPMKNQERLFPSDEGQGPESGEWGEVESPLAPPPPGPAAGPPGLWPLGPPTWRSVLALAWPVLAQQFLTWAVLLSDQFLAGYFQPEDPGLHVAYQSAQTTAIYLSWLINSYIILVSVGSTALAARFVGAGDRAGAVRVTHQSL